MKQMAKNGLASYNCCPSTNYVRSCQPKWKANKIIEIYYLPWNKWQDIVLSYESNCVINSIDLLDCCLYTIDLNNTSATISETGTAVNGYQMSRELLLTLSLPVDCDSWALLQSHLNSRLVMILAYNNFTFEVLGIGEGLVPNGYTRTFGTDGDIMNITYIDTAGETSNYLSLGNQTMTIEERFDETITYLRQHQCLTSDCCSPPPACTKGEFEFLDPSYFVFTPDPWLPIPENPNPINTAGNSGTISFNQIVGAPNCPQDTIVTVGNITQPDYFNVVVSPAATLNGIKRYNLLITVDRDYINANTELRYEFDLIFTGCCDTKTYKIIAASIK